MGEQSAISVKNVVKTYDTGTKALVGVDLEIPKGEFFGLLGPNGAGKSTLISVLAGLALKSEGEVHIEGISIDQDPDKTRTFIGLVPQEFNFNIFEKVQDIVADQAGYYGITRSDVKPRVEEVLTQLGLWEKRESKAMDLSGGMKRRLMIARALVHKPEILLLDEPTAGVDVELRRGMWDFLRELNNSGTTIVLTTHYLEEVEVLCNKVAIINKGNIIAEGGVKELISKLQQVKLILDTREPVLPAAMVVLRDLDLKKIDDTTLELTIKNGEPVNDAIRKISSTGINIMNVRNPGSQLEEVFVNLIEKDTV
jgi:ABC-2 type transport system ATP-binding protein